MLTPPFHPQPVTRRSRRGNMRLWPACFVNLFARRKSVWKASRVPSCLSRQILVSRKPKPRCMPARKWIDNTKMSVSNWRIKAILPKENVQRSVISYDCLPSDRILELWAARIDFSSAPTQRWATRNFPSVLLRDFPADAFPRALEFPVLLVELACSPCWFNKFPHRRSSVYSRIQAKAAGKVLHSGRSEGKKEEKKVSIQLLSFFLYIVVEKWIKASLSTLFLSRNSEWKVFSIAIRGFSFVNSKESKKFCEEKRERKGSKRRKKKRQSKWKC